MQNETRVNLQHLLEDIRDSYTARLEEVVITELMANALDSGASRVEFFCDHVHNFIRCTDNGAGMRRVNLREYHNIAASTKVRGSGIGFAGIGAKLSLLIADKVVTETKGAYGTQSATEWHLTNPFRAPWKFIPYAGNVSAARGTAVTIYIRNTTSLLLEDDFIRKTIVKHFYSLLHPRFTQELLRFMYRNGVEFYLNGQKVELTESTDVALQHWFKVFLGKSRKPVGIGYITQQNQPLVATQSATAFGLAVSTYGKTIKTGWEWLGILPKNYQTLSGVVEIPALAELLTTNKNDFLSDATHLKKYYRYRKAVQESVLTVLRSLGEERVETHAEPDKIIKPLRRQIEETLSNMVNDFPELSPLVGVRRRLAPAVAGESTPEAAFGGEREQSPVSAPPTPEILDTEDGVSPKQGQTQNTFSSTESDTDSDTVKKAKQPGLNIILEAMDAAENYPPLGRMAEDTIAVNTNHPAWQKAQKEGAEEYHILLTVALVLSGFLEEGRSAQDFLSKFLADWGNQDVRAKLF